MDRIPDLGHDLLARVCLKIQVNLHHVNGLQVIDFHKD